MVEQVKYFLCLLFLSSTAFAASFNWPPIGAGSVTSVGLSLPNIFSVSGSPVTGSGTISASLASQSANTTLVAPNGSSGTPTFRLLVPADIPNLSQPTKTLYVDNQRTDSYTADGTILRPFKTIQAGINQVATNADNATFPYLISISAGDYPENLTFNNANLFDITLDGHEAVVLNPATGTSVDSSSNNMQMTNVGFVGITFAATSGNDINIVGATTGGSFLNSDGYLQDCNVFGTLVIKNAVAFDMQDTHLLNNLTIENLVTGSMRGGQASGGTQVINTIPGNNQPAGFSSTGFSFDYLVTADDLTCGAGSLCSYRMASRIGAPGGTITANGEVRAYSSFFRSNVVVNSGGTLSLRGSMLAGTITNNSGTLAEAGYHYKVLVNGATDLSNLFLSVNNGHMGSKQTTAPTATVNANAGTSATCAVSHATDTAGLITLVTGTVGTPATGVQCTVNFNMAYNVAPICSLTPANTSAGINPVQEYVGTVTTSTLPFAFNVAGGTSTTYLYNYQCIETQ